MERYMPLTQHNYFPIFLCCVFIGTISSVKAAEINKTTDSGEYQFSSGLFKGNVLSQSMLQRFNEIDKVEAGIYKVDVYVNNRFIERRTIEFKPNETSSQGITPCLTTDFLDNAGVLGDVAYRQQQEKTRESMLSKKQEQNPSCLILDEIAPSSTAYFDFSLLRLNLTIPQSLMRNIPRGYVKPTELSSGESIGFINYTGNYYYSDIKNSQYSNTRQDSSFLNLNGGVNWGKWQYRQQSSLSIDNEKKTEWNHLRSYVQRPIDQLQSQLIVGQLYTSGRFFSGLPFKGLSLATDERMRPNSLRGYAPVIRGTAKSNAKVSIRQDGKEIYQITVAPGPFEITDLYPTSYSGNLFVEVTEADGSTHSTEVPYAAVPLSLREGLSNYNFVMGRTDLDDAKDVNFADFTYEYGVNNSITLNGGLRVADRYQAGAIGGVYGSSYGAFGSNITYSRGKLPSAEGADYVDGWMANLTYSKTFQPTDTVISIAGYRYSTAGFRDLNDVLGLRHAWEQKDVWSSYNYLQRSRFQVNLSQSLGEYGSVYLSGSTQDYRDGRDRDTLYQAGYMKTFGIVSLNVNYTRQRTHSLTGTTFKEDRFDNFGGISISVPLGRERSPLTPNLNVNYSHSNTSDIHQLGITGALDKDYSLSYSLGATLSDWGEQTTYTAGLYKRLPIMQVGLNTAFSEQYKQASLNLSGALALHSGGITFGPYLGDTFALIEAKGAKGAKVISSPYSKIDRFGYALIPSINPYHYNTIALDPQGMAENVELQGGEQRIAPYAGAAVKVNFKTRFGHSVLIQTETKTGESVPMGADVLDEESNIIGMVGQAGQVYFRAEKQQGALTLKWGNQDDQSCKLTYRIDDEQLNQPLIKQNAQCEKVN
ncbi:fimbrial biogenesis outer membrane usher protein [Acinetobacter sp. C26M]|uniref:fimbria/pilus outer membrane usher protein n=1 Tax=unclassified Acinetobacter TaxID=196816 RepID=UPI0020376434|nr:MULTISPECIES: fimbria/pilus outer membrane usher protein [unclassified Acinetobacter]USA47467.1 fimbrial biogenesis outer membrane usher protein [Acinetobacter sp. C26M]USA50948.1 fimbrial biogenesis outer membrane usher protein [Acinetobacter sp. C26G]